MLLSLLSYNILLFQVLYNDRSANLYNSHAGGNMNFPWTVGLQVLWLAERGLPEEISFDVFRTAGLDIILPVVGFETNALGEQK